jgi:hypothetical protein
MIGPLDSDLGFLGVVRGYRLDDFFDSSRGVVLGFSLMGASTK